MDKVIIKKCQQPYYDLVVTGRKNWELRYYARRNFSGAAIITAESTAAVLKRIEGAV